MSQSTLQQTELEKNGKFMKFQNLLFSNNSKYSSIIILASAVFFFFPFLGSVHLFDWDEINFAESAREMILTGNYTRVQVNFNPFWEKPPLFFWLQSISMHLFGINEYAARFPNAVFGVITLLTFFLIGKKLYNEKFGVIWALAYMGSFLPHLYFKSGIIDPVFNYFIFLGVFFLAQTIRYKEQRISSRYALFAGILIGLAILTKGPVGFLILFLTFLSYWALNKFRTVGPFRNIAIFAASTLVVSFFWYGLELIKNGTWFITEFIDYHIRLFSTPDAGHKQPFFYHFVVVLIGCFPMSIFALKSFAMKKDADDIDFQKWMLCLFWVVMILFSIVTTKIVHYSSMAYFPLSFLAAYYLYHVLEGKLKVQKFMIVSVTVFGAIFSLILTIAPLIAYYKDLIIPYIKDPFAVASFQTPVEWTGFEFLIGLAYFTIVLFSIRQFRVGKTASGIISIFYATAIVLFFYLAIVVPKIEGYSQKPAIAFYQSISSEDAYVATLGFKSYAHYFYAQVKDHQNEKSNDSEWLLSGEIDKPAYFVTKIHKQERVAPYKDVKLIKTAGGFAFFKREKVK